MCRQNLYLLAIALLSFSCGKDDDDTLPYAETELMPGGEGTISSSGPDAYTFPLSNLSGDNITRHFEADAAFEQSFVTFPSTQAAGVGPLFNQNSCASCHIRNGRSQPPSSFTDANSGLLMRLSMPGAGAHGEPLPVDGFGGQLQTKSIFGVSPEGKLELNYIEQIVAFLDGTQVSLRNPQYQIVQTYQPMPAGVLTSPRNAPPVFGLGLLEAIPESDILALADEHDSDGDGISGKPNYAWDIASQQMKLGRFGWKAANPTLAQQTADAFHQDMGVTSAFYFPLEHCEGQSNCSTGIGNEPDITREFAELTAFYSQSLGVPAPRNFSKADVQAGRRLFLDIGCAGCHVPKYTTGAHATSELAAQTIYPYSDMLLHDMGEGLADHRPDFLANGLEWRTPPLWGIGLTQIVNSKATFLHDGRARTLTEAILWHGGEGEAAKEKFRKLSQTEREQVLRFLESL